MTRSLADINAELYRLADKMDDSQRAEAALDFLQHSTTTPQVEA